MTWLRLYTGILNDPKVQNLPPDVFKSWINLLCVAKETDKPDGLLPDVETIAFMMRVSQVQATKLLSQLVKHGLIDKMKQGYVPHNWGGRQFTSDVSNERVKRHRERQRNGECNAECNGDVTPPERAEQSTEQRQSRQKEKQIDALRAVLDEQHAVAIIEHRAKLRKPLTLRAAELLAKQLARHADPNAAADTMILKGWQSFDPEWGKQKPFHRGRDPDQFVGLGGIPLREVT